MTSIYRHRTRCRCRLYRRGHFHDVSPQITVWLRRLGAAGEPEMLVSRRTRERLVAEGLGVWLGANEYERGWWPVVPGLEHT